MRNGSSSPRRRINIYGVIAILLVFTGWSLSEAQVKGHPDVWLKNGRGDLITAAQNSSDAYSPKKTCGSCHGYGTITEGYHFQQGFDVVSDLYHSQKPWELSNGMYGKWNPFVATGRLAPKVNQDARQMDLSTYDWIGGGGKLEPAYGIKEPACGWCHPGGGPMEYGRDRSGKADFSKNLAAAEALHTDPLDGDFSSRYTPDRRSRFKESGVLEADCLLCHLTDYRFDDRNRQISARNYGWAATAGAGLGRVEGEIFQYKRKNARPQDSDYEDGVWRHEPKPAVKYHWQDKKRFTGEGKLRGAVVNRRVSAKNCLFCHEAGEAKNTGTIYEAKHDSHVKQGLRCTDCHPLIGNSAGERLRHQIAKGRSLQLSVRDDLDGIGMKTCVGCHYDRQYRKTRSDMPAAAPDPQAAHQKNFPKAGSHFYIIQCNGCHATAQPAKALYLLDMSMGREIGFTADHLERVVRHGDYAMTAKAPWKPWITRKRLRKGDDERYIPSVPKLAQWFGEKMPNGEIRPISLHQVRSAAGKIGAVTMATVKGTDGKILKLATIQSDGDIRKMISALTARGFRNVVYVTDQLYGMSRGKLAASPLPPSARVQYYAVVHGVNPLDSRMVYGAGGKPNGCMNCHADDAPFFSKIRVNSIRGFMKDYPALKSPNVHPQMKDWGLDDVPPFE
jgi:hypothetical protein